MAHVRKQLISIFLTNKCNLNCVYCYTHKSNGSAKSQVIDLKFASRGISDFFRDYPSRHVRFYGAGEPTLEFERLKQIAEFARSLAGDKLTLELQTNGYFGKEIGDWIAENINILWISFDGPESVQNKQRMTIGSKPSFDVVKDNLGRFNNNENIQVGIRVTITPENISKQKELVEYFHEIGIKYVNVHPACVSIDDKTSKVFDWDAIEFAENYVKAFKRAEGLGLFYNSLYTANFDEKTRFACRALVPYPHLTTDGYVSACDFSQYGEEINPGPLQQLIYGKYNVDLDYIEYDEKKIHNIRNRNSDTLKENECKDCGYVYHCAGGCVGQVVNETGSLFGIHKKNCEVTKYLAKHLPLNYKLNPVLHS